jgi:glyoxylase-like metal-dependent hydrolase (beta-lactamase superfamily II)
MAADLLDLADRLWRGETDIADHHPIAGMWGEMAELGHGAAFVAAFSNVAAFASDEGMVLVDTSSPFLAGRVHHVLQSWRDEPLHTAVFTHGHIDHVFGVERYEAALATEARVPRGSSPTRRFRRASTATSRPRATTPPSTDANSVSIEGSNGRPSIAIPTRRTATR